MHLFGLVPESENIGELAGSIYADLPLLADTVDLLPQNMKSKMMSASKQAMDSITTPSKHRLLVVGSGPSFDRSLARLSQEEHLVIERVQSGMHAIERLHKRFDLVICNDILVDMSGRDLLRFCSDVRYEVPVLMVSELGTVFPRTHALDLNVAGYISKPQPNEMISSVHALLQPNSPKRIGKRSAPSGSCIDFDMRYAFIRGSKVYLTPKESEMLRLFIADAGRILTHSFMLGALNMRSDDVQGLRNCVGRLRKKVEPDPNEPSLIRTIRGVGYNFSKENISPRGDCLKAPKSVSS